MSEILPDPVVPPQKRLAVFLDGTWNTVNDNTNVWRLKSLLAPKGPHGVERLYPSMSFMPDIGAQALSGPFVTSGSNRKKENLSFRSKSVGY
jgi:hypothetical protein